jgi:hypothetical protein
LSLSPTRSRTELAPYIDAIASLHSAMYACSTRWLTCSSTGHETSQGRSNSIRQMASRLAVTNARCLSSLVSSAAETTDIRARRTLRLSSAIRHTAAKTINSRAAKTAVGASTVGLALI